MANDAQIVKTPILGAAYTARSVNAADNRMINLFPEIVPDGGKEAAFLQRAPGLRKLATIGTGPIRGMLATSDYGYLVSGNKFYRMDSDWAAVEMGTVSGSGPVSMAFNGLQIFIACNPQAYLYTLDGDVFEEITDEDFPGAQTVAFIDGYFIFNEPGSQRFWITASYDGAQIDPLEFASAEGSPDELVTLIADHNELWLFGANSVEVWYDAGLVDFPFTRIQGAFNELGCAAPYSVAKMDNSVFWLGADSRGQGIVYRAKGYAGERISTHAIEWQIRQYGDLSDAIGYAYQQDGHSFYVLTFPSANATWVYDAATSAWHQRAYLSGGSLIRHRSNCQMAFANEIVVGDFEDGRIYAFDLDYFSDDGNPQKWLRSWRPLPPGTNKLNRTAHFSLQVDMETGYGVVA